MIHNQQEGIDSLREMLVESLKTSKKKKKSRAASSMSRGRGKMPKIPSESSDIRESSNQDTSLDPNKKLDDGGSKLKRMCEFEKRLKAIKSRSGLQEVGNTGPYSR